MGDHSNFKISGANPTGVYAGEGLESCGSGNKDPRDCIPKQMVASNVEDAHVSCLSPRSRLSCNAVERQAREDGKWTSLEMSEVVVKAGFVNDSFRSDDSEALALWEEKERSPKAASTDFSWLKPAESQSPWRGSVSNAVKKMEILSHAWARTSPVDPKAGATKDSPRLSLEYVKRAGGRSSWKDSKIVSSPVRSSEMVSHISSKVRYSNKSPCRRPDRTELPFSGPMISAKSPLDSGSPDKLRHSGSCELVIRSSTAARALDLNRSKQQAGDESEPSLRSVSEAFKPKSVEGGMSQELPARTSSAKFDDAPQTISAAVERAISRQSMRISAEAVSSFKERCSSSRSSHSTNEAMLYGCTSEAGGQQARAGTSHSQETHEPKVSKRYYGRAASRKKSSCWNSFDDTHLDHSIDFVAPSAARFLSEDEGSISPVGTPIKRPGAVPFKWEKEPGKPKEDSDSACTSGQLNVPLTLPPRLAVGHQLCPSVSSSRSSPLRSPCGNPTMSSSLRELHALPSPGRPSSESQEVLLPWFSTSFGNTFYSLRSASSERDPSLSTASELPMRRKSKSVGEVRICAPQSISRVPVGQDQGTAHKPRTNIARQPGPSSVVMPPSPRSILCGPDAGSRSSSNNPSLLSQSSFPSLISCDSIENRIDDSCSELLIPGSRLTSPFRATLRGSSVSYNPDFEDKYLSSSTDYQKGAAHSESAFVKFCKVGKRWMKKSPSKSHSKLGTTNQSPEVWQSPSLTIQHDANYSDFSARLGEGSPSSQGYFLSITSATPHEDLGNRSPANAATVGLLPSVQKLSSKKLKNRQTKPPPRTTWKSTRRLRMRARLRARFLVPTRRALRTLLTGCTFRHGDENVEAAEPKLLYQYHVHHRSH